MILFYDVLLLLFGFLLLIKGADLLIKGAIGLARKYQIAEWLIGVTIVALGTSLPELFVNIFSSRDGHSEMVFANIIGSNVFNLFFIMGLLGTIYPTYLDRMTVFREMPIMILSTGLVFILANDGYLFDQSANQISRIDGMVLIALFGLFIYLVYRNLRVRAIKKEVKETNETHRWKLLMLIVLGTVATSIGGALVVYEAVDIASELEVSERLIALTMLAPFTSLPELFTSLVAMFRKKSDLALGNIIGSNIFNFLMVLSISSFVRELDYDKIYNFDLNFFFFGSLLLFIAMFSGRLRRLQRGEALIFLIFFCSYIYFVFIRL